MQKQPSITDSAVDMLVLQMAPEVKMLALPWTWSRNVLLSPDRQRPFGLTSLTDSILPDSTNVTSNHVAVQQLRSDYHMG